MWGHYKKRISARLRLSGAGGLSFLCVCLFGGAASAEFESPKSEYFTGFEASDNYASGYVGAGYALGKSGLYEPGYRLRAVGAYGRYHYDGALLTDDGYVPTTFDGEDAYLAALAGYQFRTGRLITKLFVGIEAEDQHIVPHDPNNSVQGSALGLRLQQETCSTSRPGSTSRPTRPMAPPSRNIARCRGSASPRRPAWRSGSKAARSATKSTTLAAPAAF
jgi:Cellulose biosynthesis protein BcsS